MPLSLPLSVTVALFYDSVWNDISQYVLLEGGDAVQITRGLTARQRSRLASPATCTLTLDNSDGRFTLRNFASPLFGKLNRGTQLRVQVTTGAGTATMFVGEIPEWPLRPANALPSLVRMPITAYGVLRRLTRSERPSRSPLRRFWESSANQATYRVVGYWPLEDGTDTMLPGAQFIGYPKDLATSMTVVERKVTGRNSNYVASLPAPKVGPGWLTANATSQYFVITSASLLAHVAFPASVVSSASFVALYVGGTGFGWAVQIEVGTTYRLRLVTTDSSGAAIFTGAFNSTNITADQPFLVLLTLTQNGVNVDYAITTIPQSNPESTSTFTGTVTNRTVGVPARVDTGARALVGDDLAVAHVVATAGLLVAATVADPFTGHTGELVSTRLTRVFGEDGVTVNVAGTGSARLGAQSTGTLADVVRDAVEAEGILVDSRASLAVDWWAWSTRRTGFNTLTLAYTTLEPPFSPQDSDDSIVNLSRVTRRGGQSATAEVTSGRLSTSAAPAGVGVYDESVTLSLGADDQALQHAWHRVSIGTWDEVRLPELTVNLIDRNTVADAVIAGTLDIGTRLTLTGLPAWASPDSLDQFVDGYAMTIGKYRWLVTYYTSPAGPWLPLTEGSSTLGRADGQGSTLAAAVVSTVATSLSVAAGAGALWTTAVGDMPFDIVVSGTERMTVTAISGASSPQTFTVTRGVGGFVTTHLAGASVALWRPGRAVL